MKEKVLNGCGVLFALYLSKQSNMNLSQTIDLLNEALNYED